MKKINLDDVQPVCCGPGKEYFNRFYVYHNYCPQKVIAKFWDKYSLLDSKMLVSHLYAIAVFGRDGVSYPIKTDDLGFAQFQTDVGHLLNAVYFEYKYNRKKPLKFIEKGGGYEE